MRSVRLSFGKWRQLMKPDSLNEKHTERIREWVTGGEYVVAVEVEAVIYPERPGEPYLSPETIRHLENLERLAVLAMWMP